jgi:hypothetical protein
VFGSINAVFRSPGIGSSPGTGGENATSLNFSGANHVDQGSRHLRGNRT